MRRRDQRGPWYLLTGLVLGFVGGLLFAWGIAPLRYIDTAPASLRAEFKDQYRAMIASAYMATGDLVRAQARLSLLGDEDPARALTIQAQQALAAGRPEAESRALGMLAMAVGQGAAPLATAIPVTQTITSTANLPSPTLPALTPSLPVTAPSLTPAPPSPTPRGSVSPSPRARTPEPTVTPLPTRTPTPTPGEPFALQDMELVCNPALQLPLIMVETFDAANQPVPAVEIIISWDGGEDHFFTGLKPEMGLGYADFTMTLGVNYTLRLAAGGQPVPDIHAQECEVQGRRFWGAWQLIFVQP